MLDEYHRIAEKILGVTAAWHDARTLGELPDDTVFEAQIQNTRQAARAALDGAVVQPAQFRRLVATGAGLARSLAIFSGAGALPIALPAALGDLEAEVSPWLAPLDEFPKEAPEGLTWEHFAPHGSLGRLGEVKVGLGLAALGEIQATVMASRLMISANFNSWQAAFAWGMGTVREINCFLQKQMLDIRVSREGRLYTAALEGTQIWEAKGTLQAALGALLSSLAAQKGPEWRVRITYENI